MRCFLTGLAIAAMMAASFAAISLTVARALVTYEEARRTVAVGSSVPRLFPVLVVYPSGQPGGHEARIVFHSYLPDFVRQHPQSTYRVPPGAMAELNDWLSTHPSLRDVSLKGESRFGAGRFEVSDLPGGRQALKVEGTWDDDRVNIGWYETDGRTITPKRYVTYFGPGLVLKSFPISVVLTLGVWLVSAILIVRRRRRRSTA